MKSLSEEYDKAIFSDYGEKIYPHDKLKGTLT